MEFVTETKRELIDEIEMIKEILSDGLENEILKKELEKAETKLAFEF
jgi:hypothetical protein